MIERSGALQAPPTQVFPPALVPMLRHRLEPTLDLPDFGDGILGELLTTVFFAGLELYEGEHRTIGVVLVGRHRTDVVLPEACPQPGLSPTYCWKLLGFETPRPFAVRELVKLATASADERLFAAVSIGVDGKLAIGGLAREGYAADGDPFIRVIVSRPGCLSIRNGRSRLLEYERGVIIDGADDVLFGRGAGRAALLSSAHAAGLEPAAIDDYLHAVRELVAAMSAHGHGGILVISPDDVPAVESSIAYRMTEDSSIAAMLRLARRLPRGGGPSYGAILRSAFLAEVGRMIEECGALTGIDGATILNHSLALVAFGAMLPVGSRPVVVATAKDVADARVVDLGPRGTRHHASAAYAADHPGAIVFVASEDGSVSCMLREPAGERVLAWHLPGERLHKQLREATTFRQ
jgi:hypothetical protein